MCGLLDSSMKKCARSSDMDRIWGSKIEAELEVAEEEAKCLIPGIPNEITVFKILTKLPWTELQTISQISKPWRRVVQNRQVHDERVRASTTQILVPILHHATDMCQGMFLDCISLYEPAIDRWYLLPPVPPLERGIPEGCGCACVDGKIYLIGGLKIDPNPESHTFYGSIGPDEFESRNEVYSLDVAAGHTEWRRCADLNRARAWFQCGVMDGNIYVFFGVNGWRPGRKKLVKDVQKAVVEVEVYDPEADIWDLVADVPYEDVLKYSSVNKVATGAGDTFVFQSYFLSDYMSQAVEHTYDTCKDEWKILSCTKGEMDPTDAFVAMDNKLCQVPCKTFSHLKTFDGASSSWKSTGQTVTWNFLEPWIERVPYHPYLQELQLPAYSWSEFSMARGHGLTRTCSEASCGRLGVGLKKVEDLLALAVIKTDLGEEEYLALTKVSSVAIVFESYLEQVALFKGKWCGEEKLELVFSEIDCPYKPVSWQRSSLCTLEL